MDDDTDSEAREGEYGPSPIQWVRDQVALYESSGGTQGATLRDTGRPVVLLTTVGIRSGKVRKTPLMRVEHQGVYVAVGSQGGAPHDPLWCRNLQARPDVELQDGPRVMEMTARLVHGAERGQWWERAVSVFPPYASYQERTEREIPVFLLEPAPTDRPAAQTA